MEFDEFLREVAPLLGLQWRPFKRRGIKRKVERRIAQLHLSDFEEYVSEVKRDSEEKRNLSQILTLTISRFFRDKKVFDTIQHSVLPRLLKEKDKQEFKIWSIGCASGEEPYSLSLMWREECEKIWPQVHVSILATDIDEKMLERAKEGRYKKSSLTEVPEEVAKRFFEREGEFHVLDQSIRESIQFMRHDIIHDEPFCETEIVFCRNLAFTYFSRESQIEVLKKIALSLRKNGYLIIGKDESLPLIYPSLFLPVFPREKIYQKFIRFPLEPN